MTPRLLILGCRGVPAAHGGFETFAAYLAPYLARRGWDVEVACQEQGNGRITFDDWQGVRRVRIPVTGTGPASTIAFDLRSVRYAMRRDRLVLLLGYNTAILAAALRLRGVPLIVNMDGMEWKRAKWPLSIRAWLWSMERVACAVGSHLIADHPAIADHLATRVSRRKISTIGYCADAVRQADVGPVTARGLTPGAYGLVVARPEPENSLLEIVTAHRASGSAGPLAVLGTYRDEHPYHRQVRQAAAPNVRFLGAIYDKAALEALRFHARFYVHGHQVGGTNPSLVEALAVGSPVLAHDNPFNRWVAGPGMLYFDSIEACAAQFRRLAGEPTLLRDMRAAAVARHDRTFTQEAILTAYEELLRQWQPVPRDVARPELLSPEH